MNHNVYFYCRDRNVPSVSFGFEFENSLAETRSACNPHPQRKDETVAGCQGEIATQHIYTLTRIMQGGEGTRQSRIQPRTGARSRTRYEPTSWYLLLATCLGYIPPSWITDRQTDNRKGRKKKRKHMHAINTLARIDR